MSSVEPQEHADEQDASQKRAGQLVEAGRDGSVMLDLVEEALDEVALAVEGEVAVAGLLAIGFRRDDRLDFACFQRLNKPVAIVALVSDHRYRLEPFDQRLGLRYVGVLYR